MIREIDWKGDITEFTKLPFIIQFLLHVI